MKDKLKDYKQKRDFNKTKEPKGKLYKNKGKLHFVVQHHLARKDHYDFRLEWEGTLKSWAVPKGPSYNPKDKRLAVHVEDHPISYRNFEGVIPKGEYGAGPVLIWDEGYWEPIGNVNNGLENGSIKFILHGKRLKGKWTLISFKDDNWLLIKEEDGISLYDDISKLNTSIRTNKTLEELIEEKNISIKNSKKDSIVHDIKITNPDKVIISNSKVTKYDIASYYEKVGKRMLPYIKNRILSTIKCPQGDEGTCFFSKHLDNKGLGKKKIPNNKGQKEDYYYIKDISGIISEVQMNSYEFHIWGSNVETLNKPNMLVFDLDPDTKISLSKVREGVKDLKCVLDELKLKAFLKTSGGKGYHVVVPINSLKTWKSFSAFAKNIAKFMETKWPNKYTSNIRKESRQGKIFIDWIRNTKGATSVAPYSIRVRKGAYVSMPIRWNELNKVKPNGIKIEDAIKRLKRKDPWEGFFEVDQ